MRFGYFDDDNREYVITTPKTPYPWINYLGTESFFGSSRTRRAATASTATRGCAASRATATTTSRPTSGGRYFYVSDGGDVWTPVATCRSSATLDSFECRHGLGYTRITGRAQRASRAELLFFVPLGHTAEIHQVTLAQPTSRPKKSSSCSRSSSSACGTPRTTRPTSSATSAPARSRSTAARSTTRPSTASAATTTRSTT